MTAQPASAPAEMIGRYAVHGEIASGGMATVLFGRLVGPVGFSRTVAIKRLHAHLARDPEFVTMFLDEARLAARIRHPNVVPTLDVISTDDQLLIVMEYVQGESLARLIRAMVKRGERIPPPIACGILVGVLHGLHGAHEAKSERGEPLGIVHRDVSPHNILVGTDGIPRVLDFGVAKAVGRLQTTREGQLKGKLAYMAPEQVRAGVVTRTADVYSAGVVLWEALVGERLFLGENEANTLEKVLFGQVARPSERVPELATALDEVVMRALDRDATKRFTTAREMAREIEKRVPIANASDLGDWVESIAGELLQVRARKVAEIESRSDVHSSAIAKEVIARLSSPDVQVEIPIADATPELQADAARAVTKPDVNADVAVAVPRPDVKAVAVAAVAEGPKPDVQPVVAVAPPKPEIPADLAVVLPRPDVQPVVAVAPPKPDVSIDVVVTDTVTLPTPDDTTVPEGDVVTFSHENAIVKFVRAHRAIVFGASAIVLAVIVLLAWPSSHPTSTGENPPVDTPSAIATKPAATGTPTPPPATIETPTARPTVGAQTATAPPAAATNGVPATATPRATATTTKGGAIVRDLPSSYAPPPPPPPARPPSAKPGCNPPYTVDADGTKHYKLDCL